MPKTAKKTGLKEKMLVDFELFESSLNGTEKSAIHERRKEAIEHFNKMGFPHTKVEDWKYTNVHKISKKEFQQVDSSKTTQLTKADIEPYLIPNLETNTIVLVNGIYSEKLSTIRDEADDLFMGGFDTAIEKYPEQVKRHFAQYAGFTKPEEAFAALNTAFARDGAFIYLPENTTLDYPILLLHIADARESTYIHQPRNLMVVGQSSQAQLIQKYQTIGEQPCFTNEVTELYLDKNADLQYYKIQNDNIQNAYHVGKTELRQERDSRFFSNTISWGGALVRNDLNGIHNDENCRTEYYGTYLSRDKQHIDNHTLMDHAVPNCYSNELYKGVLDDRSTCVFNGKVYVREGSTQTNAYQENKNVLLTDKATINAKPQLEIFNDDVVASHGATSGQLDENELFYLRSRGLDERSAKALLLFAFVGDVISKVKIDELKDYLSDELSKRLLKEEEFD